MYVCNKKDMFKTTIIKLIFSVQNGALLIKVSISSISAFALGGSL